MYQNAWLCSSEWQPALLHMGISGHYNIQPSEQWLFVPYMATVSSHITVCFLHGSIERSRMSVWFHCLLFSQT